MTNTAMTSRSGSEEVIRDYAHFFKDSGHSVTIFSPAVGDVTRAYYRDHGIDIVDDVDTIVSPPDIIHAHHITAFIEVMARFPGVPVVQWIHGTFGSWDITMTHPDIVHYIGVDRYRCDRVLNDGVAPDRVTLVPNTTDIDRFAFAEVDTASRRALCITKGMDDLDAIRRACAATGWELDVVGRGVGREVENLEEVIAHNTLVITTARCAIEAIAMGRSVLVADWRCLGEQVTLETWPMYREGNVDLPATWRPFSEAGLADELARVDLRKGVELSLAVRPTLAVAYEGARVEALYRRLVAAHRTAPPTASGWSGDLLRLVKGLPRFQPSWRPTEEDRIAARRGIPPEHRQPNALCDVVLPD